ncbi:phosphate signaling complex protein PhoU [Cupriavidus sp. H18C1]|uniref:Phosphate-specific transport system accessory protein PhoU n=1 Tax=Cupriavidus cauae TaxID=2608999 RepID=A0A5M8AWC7_9BURK|nr:MULTISPECIES: phosphate signaling complex protein PhoU [Cupriavidus]KAA0179061.1 phosphate signaling complex protein PhoU [Cupriavidus gilardii]KAA6128097.1 phosphate signaling complex protein PhoU [Cupriavidus cauae]MBO4121038.1 phosphate signaling complex protein PhoU [Cupriavidus gilardii]MCA7084589.1 phosphate signaling complex protein PhoU [Cupriavidus sp. DB3]MCD9122549.1 phosphate signaling complex protein PhoU [Cupriavidus sp. UGS-1]
MTDKHLSTQFDADLNAINTKLLQMGGLVEAQIDTAMKALADFDATLAEQVIERENQINALEIEIDADCGNIIARRQPTARDLRLVMAISKTITNLERAGDEAEKIAKRTKHIMEETGAQGINYAEVKLAGDLAIALLRKSLDAFARLDTVAAARIVKEDKAIDDEFRAFVRKLITYMMEDPRTISVALDFLFIAKAVERIGDHAKNIAEFIIYIVKGTDVRHTSREDMEKEALS